MSAKTGYLYVMSNPSTPDVYKIGCSLGNPAIRARQLSSSTGVATPFIVVYSKYVEAPFQVEAALHRTLGLYRVHDSREFFQVPLRYIIEEAEKFTSYPAPTDHAHLGASAYPFAELFASFPDDGQPRELDEKEQALCRDLEARLSRGDEIH